MTCCTLVCSLWIYWNELCDITLIHCALKISLVLKLLNVVVLQLDLEPNKIISEQYRMNLFKNTIGKKEVKKKSSMVFSFPTFYKVIIHIKVIHMHVYIFKFLHKYWINVVNKRGLRFQFKKHIPCQLLHLLIFFSLLFLLQWLLERTKKACALRKP